MCTVNSSHRAGTGVVVASLYYQSANKGKEGKSHKETPKPSAVVYRPASGIKTVTGGRTSFSGVGQAPRVSVHQDEDAMETAALLESKAAAEQR